MKKKKLISLDDYLSNISRMASELKYEVQYLRRYKDIIRNYKPEQFENRVMLKLSLEGLQKSIINTLTDLNNE